MTKLHLSIVAILALMLTFACSSKPDPKLQEAFGIHEQAVAAAGEVETMLDEADGLLMKIKAAMDNIPDTASAQSEKYLNMAGAITQLQTFRPNYEKWEEALVEVPGFAHDHDHADGHHEHKEAPEHVKNMSPDEILGLQKNYLVEIEGLKGALEMALEKANGLL